jgi:hypothetical protein
MSVDPAPVVWGPIRWTFNVIWESNGAFCLLGGWVYSYMMLYHMFRPGKHVVFFL